VATSQVVAAVTAHVTKAVKSGDTTVQPPSKWAAAAGFNGSEASPLRRLIARVSDNGCGRTGRYRAVSAEEMLELIQMGEAFTKADDGKKAAQAKRIHSKLYPAKRTGAKQAKTTARRKSAKSKA
jgi:hypothetical protein